MKKIFLFSFLAISILSCKEEKNDGAIGGKNEEETKKHFSERFLTSSARVQFVVLDPKNHFLEISHKTLTHSNASVQISYF